MKTLKIYLDVCSYNRPFDNQTQMKVRLETEAKLYIQTGVRAGKYKLVWSYMLNFENSKSPYEDNRKAIALWENIATEYCESSDEVLSFGKEIMVKGIKECDALHIACAIKSGCDYFITTDRRVLNKSVGGVKIINPIDFVMEASI
ncbi:MAG: type II toxin-antitoxin system VapC family toxin [Oscillospiraceae bacterium]|nr:type II toxin-antitoxin system VapC family toxin [Oscillospiraceae bacterium]